MNLQIIEEKMNSASSVLVEEVKQIDGDILIIGISGKIGFNLASKLMDALKKANKDKKVFGAARFSGDTSDQDRFRKIGVIPIVADVLDQDQLDALPKVKNVIFMVGYKFGTQGNESLTWAMNAYLPGKIAETFKDSRIVVFSTGCVYPLVNVKDGAPDESITPDPVGEYAQSCLGRERIFEYYSRKHGTEILIYRLNYAIDTRYGVLIELANSIKNGIPINLEMGHVNVIWQPDASEMAIRSLLHCTSPANIVNITGPETLSVKWIAERLAESMGCSVTFEGIESDTALLSNASKSHQLFSYPQTDIRTMIEVIALWVMEDGEQSDKPTHFQEREGKY